MLRSRSALVLFLCLSFSLSACEERSSAPNGGETVATPDGASVAAAEALLKKRELEPAIAMLQTIIAAPDAPPIATQRLAEAFAARDDLAKAIKTLRAGEERYPKAPALPVLLARIYQKLHQFPEMRAELDRARTAGASDKDVSLLYGMCLGQLQDLEGAKQEFEKALAAGAEGKVVNYNLAVILIETKEYARAKQLLEQIVADDPDWAEARRELARITLLTRSDRASVTTAVNALADLRDKLPNDWHLFEYLGDGSLLLGDFEGAVAFYTDALRLGKNPKSIEDKYRVAAGKLKEAQAAQKKAAEAAAAGSDGAPVQPHD